jgi:hypothetical protein
MRIIFQFGLKVLLSCLVITKTVFGPSLINSLPSSMGIPFASSLVLLLRNNVCFGKAIEKTPSVRVFYWMTKSPSCARRLGIQRPSLTSIGCCNGLCIVIVAALVIGTIKLARFYRLLAFDLLLKPPAHSLVLSGIQTILLASQPQSPCSLASTSTILFISWRTSS